jgi:hypothetical protein
MKLENIKIYDLEESILASGYPMRTDTDPKEITEKDLKRCKNLIKACEEDNPAHGQFLTGIRVAFDLTFSNKAWVEAERYRFLEFVSSQSTMHRITKFDLDTSYNEYVNPKAIEIMKELVAEYNYLCGPEAVASFTPDELTEAKTRKYLEILYTNPSGFELTARLTTNYRCLRNIYKQRKYHRLPEWRAFCKELEKLPYAQDFIIS